MNTHTSVVLGAPISKDDLSLSGLNPRIVDQGYDEYSDIYDQELTNVLEEFITSNGEGRLSWPVVSASKLTAAWISFGKYHHVRNERALDDIANSIVHNIARLDVCTLLLGHTPRDPRVAVEELLGGELTGEDYEKLSAFLCNQEGAWLLSDYAFNSLHPLVIKILKAETAEDKLYMIDRVLNVVHQRSDLAQHFIEGGTSTLCKIANYGTDERSQ